SRRRHTRSKRDWSSDVCSSDLSTRFSFTSTLRSLDHQLGVNMLTYQERIHRMPWQNFSKTYRAMFAVSRCALLRRVNQLIGQQRSEERRVGKEGRSRWWRASDT